MIHGFLHLEDQNPVDLGQDRGGGGIPAREDLPVPDFRYYWPQLTIRHHRHRRQSTNTMALIEGCNSRKTSRLLAISYQRRLFFSQINPLDVRFGAWREGTLFSSSGQHHRELRGHNDEGEITTNLHVPERPHVTSTKRSIPYSTPKPTR